ncbi:MAG TPA: hypothetical protein VEY67_02465, partial [Candidatus Dormibacteraeota bacterium]|nr:hypothetical protein [Candidatus Dormibacteraeota bacterium]
LATEEHPSLLEVARGHDVRCWLYHDEEGHRIRSSYPEDRPVRTGLRSDGTPEATAVSDGVAGAPAAHPGGTTR